jgi:hypothetical protein
MRRLAACVSFAFALTMVSLSDPAVPVRATTPPDTIRYAVLMAGRRVGSMTAALEGDVLTVHYEYAERGNGPSFDERVVLDAAGLPRSLDISGNDYWKNPVHDRFTVENASASWENSLEHGRAPAGSLYLPLDPTPEDYAILADELTRAPQGRATLVPTGAIALRRIEQREIGTGADHVTVTLFALDGIDLHPVYVWLDRDHRLFFSIDAAYSPATIREGSENAVSELMRAQSEADEQWQEDLVHRLARPLTRPLVIQHARLFAAEAGSLQSDSTVVVDKDRITAVGPDQKVKTPGGAEVVDAAGQTVIPGLWDMHQHLRDVSGVLDIAAGVTAVRDLANERRALRRLMDGYANGTLVGPRVIRAGLVDGAGPFAIPGAVIVTTPDEARRAVDDYAAEGYAAIKIYGSLSPALVPVIAERAHAKGLRVGGHIPAHMTAAQAIRDGYDEINHVPFLILNFVGPVETANIGVLTATFAKNAALVDPESETVRQFIALLKEHRTVIDPTLYVFERSLLWRKGALGPGYETIGERLPPQSRRGLLKGSVPIPPGMEERYQNAVSASGRFVKALHVAGVPIVAGTDFGIQGFALQRELELYVAAGIPAPQVLQLATLGAARVVGQDRELGSIAAGKLADLVLVAGDPTMQISDIRRPTLVVTRGRAYEPPKLLAALGIRP